MDTHSGDTLKELKNKPCSEDDLVRLQHAQQVYTLKSVAQDDLLYM